jgi:hypothetical protein
MGEGDGNGKNYKFILCLASLPGAQACAPNTVSPNSYILLRMF